MRDEGDRRTTSGRDARSTRKIQGGGRMITGGTPIQRERQCSKGGAGLRCGQRTLHGRWRGAEFGRQKVVDLIIVIRYYLDVVL
jgi:hypothetical protein